MVIHGLIIDPQIDFLDVPGAALAVTGANADMDRGAKLVRRLGKRVTDWHITQDSHSDLDIAHPMMWLDQKGRHPEPLTTIITSQDIEAGIWRPRNGNARPRALGGRQTLQEYVLAYTKALEAGGKYPLLIWPPHCIIGTVGHTFHSGLYDALREWCRENFATLDIVTKGSNPFTEHYGGLQAEVPLPSDPSTQLNTTLIKILSEADIILFFGEAGSHCVSRTVNQIVDNIDPKLLSKFHVITDCISPVGHYPPAPNFPQEYQDWLYAMEKKGMVLTTSEKFLK